MDSHINNVVEKRGEEEGGSQLTCNRSSLEGDAYWRAEEVKSLKCLEEGAFWYVGDQKFVRIGRSRGGAFWCVVEAESLKELGGGPKVRNQPR